MQKQSFPQTYSIQLSNINMSAEPYKYDTNKILLPPEDVSFFHFHNQLEVGICQSGSGLFFYPNNSEIITPGDIVLFFPKSTHYSQTVNVAQPCLCRFSYADLHPILFSLIRDDEYVTDLIRNVQRYDIPKVIRKKEHRELYCILKNYLNDMFTDMPNKQLILATHLAELFFKIQNSYPRIAQNPPHNSGTDKRMAVVQDYIEINYMKDIDTKQLCDISFLSESQLRRLFKSTYGVSPMKYLNSLRCKIACQLLTHTNMSIQAISQRMGFNDVSEFYRHFKSNYAVAPSVYKKSISKQP